MAPRRAALLSPHPAKLSLSLPLITMHSSSSVFSPRSLSGADLPFGRARAIKRAPRGKQAVENGLSSFFFYYYYYYHRLLMLHSLLPWWSGVGEYKPSPPPPTTTCQGGGSLLYTLLYTHTRAHWNMQIYIRKCNLKWISLTFSALNSSFYVKHEKD